MPRFIVTVQAQLANNNSGPHFSITLEAENYVDALDQARGPLLGALAESGLTVAPVIRAEPAASSAEAASKP